MNFLKQNKLTIAIFLAFSLLALWSWPKTDKPIGLEGQSAKVEATATSSDTAQKSESIASGTDLKETKSTPEIAKNEIPRTKVTEAKIPSSRVPNLPPKEAPTGQIESTGTPTTASPQENISERNTVSASIQIGTDKYAVTLPENSTAYDALVYLKDNKGLEFSAKPFSGIGFFVDEMNGIRNDPKNSLYWGYYINGKSASIGASAYVLKNNDNILWKYDKIDF